MDCIDLQGKVCPFVLFHTKKKLETVAPGGELEVILDDPTAKQTISAWCRTHPYEVQEIDDTGGRIRIVIKKLLSNRHQ